ncbi:hypothetical protein EVAR_31650_1 [Eumeta japonica]|uniref:Uncharacterized protein n=1 Tax=Eumeta variegata TaxID=151549 RepID=A0A4C1VY54_EUMVA|nr:hypothetical protein EVAR_31650_1 [Eumeta japonica]
MGSKYDVAGSESEVVESATRTGLTTKSISTIQRKTKDKEIYFMSTRGRGRAKLPVDAALEFAMINGHEKMEIIVIVGAGAE